MMPRRFKPIAFRPLKGDELAEALRELKGK